jgi:predicted Zn-dependent protease
LNPLQDLNDRAVLAVKTNSVADSSWSVVSKDSNKYEPVASTSEDAKKTEDAEVEDMEEDLSDAEPEAEAEAPGGHGSGNGVEMSGIALVYCVLATIAGPRF